MKFESTPQFNPTENPKSYEKKLVEQLSETTPILPNPEGTTEIDIATRKETDIRKSAELKEQLGAKQKTQSELEQEVSTSNENVAKDTTDRQKLTHFEKWVEEIKKQDEIGSGAQKRVYAYPEKPQQIIAVFHTEQSVNSIKERFYVNKILNFLYPNNIPDIHLAASRPAVLVIDRIGGKEINPWNLKHQISKILIRRRLSKVGILIDDSSCNFMIDQDGKVFYIDGFIGNFKWNKEKLLKRINKLRPDEKRRALNYLNRIEILEHQSIIARKQ